MQVTYTVKRVDIEAKCMDVEFSADGYESVIVGVRLPFTDENLDGVILSFVPTGVWFPRSQEVMHVDEGYSKQTDVYSPQNEWDQINLEMWSQIAYERQLAKALMKFGLLQADPTEIPAGTA